MHVDAVEWGMAHADSLLDAIVVATDAIAVQGQVDCPGMFTLSPLHRLSWHCGCRLPLSSSGPPPILRRPSTFSPISQRERLHANCQHGQISPCHRTTPHTGTFGHPDSNRHGVNTPYHLPGRKPIIMGEIIAKAATLFQRARSLPGLEPNIVQPAPMPTGESQAPNRMSSCGRIKCRNRNGK